jgi:succinoglycan biosynthesis protein ExoA
MSPIISIILPVRNERNHIKDCIASIFGQEGIDKCELFVVDGNSDDGTREVLQALRKEHPNLCIIDNPEKTVTAAVNLGIKQATGDIIMRMDAHAVYARDYLVSCVRVMQESGAANVGGTAFALPSKTTMTANAIALAHHSPFGLGGASFRDVHAKGYVETVWPGCFRKEVFERVGFLNDNLQRSEDIELNYRLRKAGYRIFLSPEIKVHYFCRSTIAALWRQRRLDGKGVMQTLRVNGGAVRLRHFVPLPATLLCLVVIAWGGTALFLGAWRGFRSAALTAGAGALVYLCASVFFTLKSLQELPALNATIENRGMGKHTIVKKSAALLPLIFATLHFSYGFGSIAGLLSFTKKHFPTSNV